MATPLAPPDFVMKDIEDDEEEDFRGSNGSAMIEIIQENKPVVYHLPENYETWNYIGRGSFGCVYHYKDPISKLDLAIKCMPVDGEYDFAEEKHVAMNEIKIHERLTHPNIVKYFTTYQIENIFMILMEFVDGGNVYDRLQNTGPFNENLVRNYTAQILEGLVYMHSQEIVHRDLRSKNILISKSNVIKISDFGISKCFTETHCSMFNSQVGNPHWKAPELIEGLGKAGRRVDVWALGIAVFEMITGDTPWGDVSSDVAQYHIYKGTAKLPLPTSVSAVLRDFVNVCLERDCSKRPHSKELLGHSLFQRFT